MKIKVPTIACIGCIDTLTQAILKLDPAAEITGDVSTKTLTISSGATEGDIKAAITAVGHELS